MKNSLFIALISILILACVKDKKTNWDTNFLAPIVKSELSISNLLNNEIVVENPDSTLKLIYSTELYSIPSGNLMNFPDTILEFGASLRSLELPNDTFTYKLTLGAIARAQGGFIGSLIIASHNNSIAVPPLNGLSSEDIEIDIGNLFESIIIDKGKAEIIIINNLPLDIENVDFMVKNNSIHGGGLILRDTFATILQNTTFSKEIPIDGKTLYSDLIAQIVSLNTPGSGTTPVLIDTNAALTAQIIIKDLKPKEAKAIWPQQSVINKTKLVTFSLDTNYLFKDAILKGGAINFDLYSSLQDSIRIKYTVPNLVHPVTKESFKIDTVIPPAIANGLSKINLTYRMDDYYFLLNGYGIESYYSPKIDYDSSGTAGDAKDLVNAFITILEAKIQYSGQLKTISVDDSIYVHASIVDLAPKYARGHIGSNIEKIGPDTIDIGIFNNIRSGSIDLDQVNFEIETVNGIGVTALATLNKLQSKNKQGNLVSLNMTDNTMSIAKAIDNGTYANQISSSKILNSGNSNITDFISNMPNKIIYDINVEINGVDNPSNNVDTVINNPPNFLYYDSGMKTNLNIEIPLSFFVDSLVLVDTIDFDFNTEKNRGVESGEFTLFVDNGFPFNATTTLYFMDDNYIIIDSLWSDQTIIKGNIGISGKVVSSNESQIQFKISKEKMDVIKTARKIHIVAGFHTFDILDPSAVHQKIYSHYTFKMKLVGDFNYIISN